MLNPEALFIKGPVRLTATQVRVVDYILANPDQAAFHTAAELGKGAGVSDATVVRLAQTLGFSGFSEMQRHLRGRIISRLDTGTRLRRTTQSVASLADVLRVVMRADLSNLAQTLETTSLDTFAKVVEQLRRADEVYVIGLRSAHALAVFLASALKVLGRRVQLLTPGFDDVWSDLENLGSGSLLVAFSFPRYTSLTVEVARACKAAGATVIAFTDSALSPLATAADLVMPASFALDSYLESFVAALSLINAIVTGIAFLEGRQTLVRLSRLERMWKERHVYYPEGEEEGAPPKK